MRTIDKGKCTSLHNRADDGFSKDSQKNIVSRILHCRRHGRGMNDEMRETSKLETPYYMSSNLPPFLSPITHAISIDHQIKQGTLITSQQWAVNAVATLFSRILFVELTIKLPRRLCLNVGSGHTVHESGQVVWWYPQVWDNLISCEQDFWNIHVCLKNILSFKSQHCQCSAHTNQSGQFESEHTWIRGTSSRNKLISGAVGQ